MHPKAPITAIEAGEIGSIIAHRIAHHAQALGLPAGGDASHVLCEKQPFAPGGHKTRGLKLIRGSLAGDMSADAFCSAAEEMIRAARGPMGGIQPGEAVDDKFMEQLDTRQGSMPDHSHGRDANIAYAV